MANTIFRSLTLRKGGKFMQDKLKAKILRDKNGQFVETVAETADPIFQVSSVASANDCTGIAVTVPNDEAEARSVAHLAAVNVTSKESGK